MGGEEEKPTGRDANVGGRTAQPLNAGGLQYPNSDMPRGDEADGQETEAPGSHYSIDLPGMEIDKDFTSGFRKTAADLGLSQKQVEKLVGWYGDEHHRVSRMTAEAEDAAKALEAQENRELMLEWSNQYNVNRASAIRAMEQILTPSEMKLFRSAGFDQDPLFLRLFHRLRGHAPTNHPKGPMQRSASGAPMLDYGASNMPSGD
jgi:hypothetical protein